MIRVMRRKASEENAVYIYAQILPIQKSFSEQYVVHENKYFSGTPSVLREKYDNKPLTNCPLKAHVPAAISAVV